MSNKILYHLVLTALMTPLFIPSMEYSCTFTGVDMDNNFMSCGRITGWRVIFPCLSFSIHVTGTGAPSSFLVCLLCTFTALQKCDKCLLLAVFSQAENTISIKIDWRLEVCEVTGMDFKYKVGFITLSQFGWQDNRRWLWLKSLSSRG